MRIFFAALLLVIGCSHICFGKDTPVYSHMEDNCVNGRGSITFYDGSRYVGEFKDGELHGQGTVTFPDGSKYSGEFWRGEINGQGAMTFSNDSEYVGEFKDGTLCGRGTVIFADGSFYEGQFEDDNYHGKGAWFSPYGIRYEGQFKNGKFDGQGIYSLPDGSRYIGYFKDDSFQGQGTWDVDETTQEESEPGKSVLKESEVAAAYSTEPLNRQMPESGIDDGEVRESLQDENSMVDGAPGNAEYPPSELSGLAFSVQVGAFRSKTNAGKLAALLREKGYEARQLPLTDYNNRSWYTVRLGSYSSLKSAQEKAGAFSEKEKMTATVRPVDSL
jgi:hypothetical protein